MLDCQIFGNGGVMNKRKGGNKKYPPLPKLINLGNSEVTTNGVKKGIKFNSLLCNFLETKLIFMFTNKIISNYSYNTNKKGYPRRDSLQIFIIFLDCD